MTCFQMVDSDKLSGGVWSHAYRWRWRVVTCSKVVAIVTCSHVLASDMREGRGVY